MPGWLPCQLRMMPSLLLTAALVAMQPHSRSTSTSTQLQLRSRTSWFMAAASTRAVGGPSLRWINGPVVPAGSTSPYAGATYMYRRDDLGSALFGLPRLSPFDLEVIVWGADNSTISSRSDVAAAVTEGVNTIYFWNSSYWRQEFHAGGWSAQVASEVVGNKSNLFWEELAQQLAQRVLGSRTPDAPVYLYGPACVSPTGKVRCDRAGISDAARIAIKTKIVAARDDVMPVTRAIYLFVERRPFSVYDVTYSVSIPTGVRIASPWREFLDMRPIIGGDHKLNSSVVIILADSPRDRPFYPDYNLLFIPLRHLVFQGEVSDPKLPGSSMRYASIEELRLAVARVVDRMRQPATATAIAKQLEPFFTHRYYYMFVSA
jgi:hypothetical protein